MSSLEWMTKDMMLSSRFRFQIVYIDTNNPFFSIVMSQIHPIILAIVFHNNSASKADFSP